MDGRRLWGAVDGDELAAVVVVSPHFDDAALGTAHLLTTYPGSTVITVLGGRPAAYPDPASEWDAAGGFTAGDDVVAVRREEDRAATASMGAHPVWLEFADHQYLAPDERLRPVDVAPVLARAIAEAGASAVFLPMGLANPDHVLTHDAGLLARDILHLEGSDPSWFCYEDGGYKHLPGLLAWRVAKLFRSGLWPTPAMVPVVPDAAAKRTAIECYATQLAPLRRDHLLDERLAANVPEQYWRLDPPPPGWEGLSSADDLTAD
ncbi:MAG: PIG-L family deacetylase [Acidimicrobiales bacterium]|jgi:LmbE family N-acetylglucosaminyl deacetylase